MIILSIETSCDETAVSLVRADGDFPNATYTVLGNALRSQIDVHKAYGGVFPSLAKRDHAAVITTLLLRAVEEAGLPGIQRPPTQKDVAAHTRELLTREGSLGDELLALFAEHDLPLIDCIAVTTGPGLEPALWVGVNFAKALAFLLDAPLVPTNHMEGHILASAFEEGRLAPLRFPALALLISGGHTEFILMRGWRQYEKVGQTRDDAVGEAFDKVARLLGLPYPGGPEISALAHDARARNLTSSITLPRPMLDSEDFDVSFSGIKTAVRYAVAKQTLSDDERRALAREFEDAVTEVLLLKTKRAIDTYAIRSLLIGGGVSANQHIRTTFEAELARDYPDLALYIPDPALTTDNSVMIALAGHAHAGDARKNTETIRAEGNKAHRKIPKNTELFT